MELLMFLGGIIFFIIISYIASAGILELFKSDLKSIHILALIIFILLFSISNCSNQKERFNKENPELKEDF
jgi:hypothetical protein